MTNEASYISAGVGRLPPGLGLVFLPGIFLGAYGLGECLCCCTTACMGPRAIAQQHARGIQTKQLLWAYECPLTPSGHMHIFKKYTRAAPPPRLLVPRLPPHTKLAKLGQLLPDQHASNS